MPPTSGTEHDASDRHTQHNKATYNKSRNLRSSELMSVGVNTVEYLG